MEHTMMWVALGIGGAGWLGSLLLGQLRAHSSSVASSGGGQNQVSSSFLWLGLFLPIFVWILTLPTSPPFSSGQGWGRGFLLGGLAAWLCSFSLLKTVGNAQPRVGATSPLFAAIVIACIPLIWMRHAVIEVLVGEALGWVAVTLVFLLGQNSWNEVREDVDCTPLLLNGAAFTTTVCAVAGLGVYRDFVIASVPRGTYSAVALLIAGIIALTLLFGGIIGDLVRGLRPSSKSSSVSTLVTAFLILVMPLGLSALLSMKVLDDLGLTYAIGLGALLGFVLWWLVADGVAPGADSTPPPFQVPVTAMLVAPCAFMLAYQLMQGFGVGLMLLAAWPVSILASPSAETPLSEEAPLPSIIARRSQTAHALTLLLSFVAILLLSRLFEMRFRADLRGTSLADQFALFGFLCGATIPALLASLALPSVTHNQSSRSLLHSFPVKAALPRLFLVGVLALFLPGGMLALWGAKVLPAFFAGLALCTVFSPSGWKQSLQPTVTASFCLAISLALTQWTHHFAPLAEASRAHRLNFLLWAIGGLLVLILLFDYGSRLILAASQRKAIDSKGVAP